jgi:heat shock protein HslJ
MMVSFDGFTKDQLMANKAEINLTSQMEKGKIQEVHTWDVTDVFFF